MRGAWRAFVQGPLTGAAIRVGHWLLLALGATWRVRHVGNEHAHRARLGGGPVLYALTHGVLLPLAFTYRNRSVQVLVSQSRDGEIIARVLGNLGSGAVRGSSSRGGERAIIRMAAKAREGYDLAITPDGPRGPRGSVAPGTALVAARGDCPIIPLGVASRPAWNARSWDRFLVPPPFARVWVVCGEAIHVPADTAGDTQGWAKRIGQALERVEDEARAYAARASAPARTARIPA